MARLAWGVGRFWPVAVVLLSTACAKGSTIGQGGAGGDASGADGVTQAAVGTGSGPAAGTGAVTVSGVGPTSAGTGSGMCGNGVVDPGEACDDGNASDTDGCLTTCKLASCGDGFVHAGVEECDDGNGVDTDACLSTCVAAKCGDGVVEAGIEACDDGNMVDTDACLSTCVAAKCGDGFVEAGVEACDDGNAVNGDGCSTACQVDAILYGPTHTFVGMTSSFFITQFGCSTSGGNADADALYFCQHFYNGACTVKPGYTATSTSTNPMMHTGTNCNNPDPNGNAVPNTTCIGGPCKIGNYQGPLGGLTNLICVCPP